MYCKHQTDHIHLFQALRYKKINSALEIIRAINECASGSKAANLRAVLNNEFGKKVFQREGDRILQWINEKNTGWQFNRLTRFNISEVG